MISYLGFKVSNMDEGSVTACLSHQLGMFNHECLMNHKVSDVKLILAIIDLVGGGGGDGRGGVLSNLLEEVRKERRQNL